ncbi:MAG: hypothetical protein V1658_00560 [Candidatus Micrarchaeota archaeon]
MGWRKAHELFRGANVRYVAIAGLLAVKHHPPKKIEEYVKKEGLNVTDHVVEGCVGIAYRKFIGAKFKTRIVPNMVYPHKPSFAPRVIKPGRKKTAF